MKSLHILRSVISRSDSKTKKPPTHHHKFMLMPFYEFSFHYRKQVKSFSLSCHRGDSNLCNFPLCRSMPDESRCQAHGRHLQKTSIVGIDEQQSTERSVRSIRLSIMSDLAAPFQAFTGRRFHVIGKLQRCPHVLHLKLSRWNQTPPKPEC